MTTKTSTKTGSKDIDTLVSEPTGTTEAGTQPEGPLTLTTGEQFTIERLRTRQVFRLLKIVTRGAAPILPNFRFDWNDPETFMGQLLGLITFAVPEAEDETIDFVRGMVRPVGLIEDPKSKPELSINDDKYTALYKALQNPEVDDLITIIQAIVENEGPEMVALGKRLMGVLRVQMGALTSPKPEAS